MNVNKIVLVVAVLFALIFSSISAQGTDNRTCADFHNTGCKECTDFQDDKCYWCDSDKKCRDWKWGGSNLLPTGIDCDGYNWNYRSCSLNGVGYAVIISVTAFIGLLIVICCVICCCVYCARRKKRSWRRHQEKYEDERREITERSTQRRAERKSRTDEIRRKYGLDSGEHSSKYEKFV